MRKLSKIYSITGRGAIVLAGLILVIFLAYHVKILPIILFLSLGVLITFCIVMYQRDRAWMKQIRNGLFYDNRCYFWINEEKYRGRIISYDKINDEVIIRTSDSDIIVRSVGMIRRPLI